MIKRMAFVGLVGSFVAASQPDYAQNQPPPAHCCVEAFETAPVGNSAATCGGLRWSKAHPGYCATTEPKKGDSRTCSMEGSQALVTVHEFRMTWDEYEGRCRIVQTDEKGTAQVATCDGSAC
ncbi:MAG TPA: hypothetical protein VIE43_19715 [Thermoanaerobaculia bacterium]|jgi:hypothetical protein|nr:hypothetical protein [Thermoanaerobaculia bacterium]